jgi:hypothetical protein
MEKLTLKIQRDPEPTSPREDENLGLMACWHRKYKLGDVQPHMEPKAWLEKNAPKGSIEMMVYMMDHSGLTLSTTDSMFHAVDPNRWDWGPLGQIVATPDNIRKFFGVKRLTQTVMKKALQQLRREVEIYNLYLNEQVWGFTLKDAEGELLDSCWGFLGSTLEETGLKDAIPVNARPLLEEAWTQRS